MTRIRLAWALFALSAACLLAATVIPFVWGSGFGALLSEGSFGLPYVLVGLVITVRRPGHPIGWGFALTGLCFALQAATVAYADAAFRPGGPHLAGAAYVGNVTQWVFAPGVYLGFTLPFLLFPDGHLLSPRWRRVAVAGAAATALMIAVNVVAPGPLNNYKQVTNPLAVDLPASGAWQMVGMLGYVGALFVSVAAVVIRFRRSRGVERLQMRWFVVGVVASAVGFALQMTAVALTGDVGPTVLFLAVLPVCSAVAILRYRLFDIDRILSRTVTYLLVTGALVGVYVGAVAVTDRGLGFSSSFAVAASTLVAAALFQPLRVRVQRVVDHRFNRARYDAGRVVDAFAGRLRDEIDPDAVRADLLTVAAQAVQPASMSLWVPS